MSEQHVQVFDTTLRDGEQAAGAAMLYEDKIQIAAALEAAGVNIIEAGFAASNDESFQTVKTIARQSSRATICSLARGSHSDIVAAAAALNPCGDRARIHVFVATDAQHMKVKLRKTPQQVLECIHDSVCFAKTKVQSVQFSPEVATTSDFAFLCSSVRAAIAAGATVINVADTKGYCFPWEYKELVSRLYREIPELARVMVSAHCHDDRGCATANTLAGVRAGVRQVECTVNGIGERAGNTALEEVVMALSLRAEVFGVTHTVQTQQLTQLSHMVAKASGCMVAPNKAFVGANAFAHESGIHQDGILKDATLYEICDASLVGAVQRLPIGRVSGRSGVAAAFNRLGYAVDSDQLKLLLGSVKEHATKHKFVTDAVLHDLAHEYDLLRV